MHVTPTERELQALKVLWQAGEATVREICDAINAQGESLAYTTVLSLLQVMEQKGLVERRAHGSDRRARIVHLTKDGRKLITRAYGQHAEDLERLMSASVTAKERATLIRLLKKIGYKAAVKRAEDAA